MLGKKTWGGSENFDFGWGKLLYERGSIFPVGQKIPGKNVKLQVTVLKTTSLIYFKWINTPIGSN